MRRKLFALLVVAIVAIALLGVVMVTSRPPPTRVSDNFQVVIRNLETGSETTIVGNLTEAYAVRFLPDGSSIVAGVLGGTRGIWRVSTLGSPALLWEGDAEWLDPSHDGSRIVWWNGSGIVLLEIQTGMTDLVPLRSLSPALYPLFTTFDPQGRRVAFTWIDDRVSHSSTPSYIATYDLVNGTVDVLLEKKRPPRSISGLAFLPDGDHILFGMDGIYLYDIVLNLTVRLTGPADAGFPRVSESGDLIVFESLTRQDDLGRPLYRIHLHRLSTGETLDVLQREQYGSPLPDISADGRTIVFIRQPTLP